MAHVWVVEWEDVLARGDKRRGDKRWRPTVSIALTHGEAKEEKRDWKEKTPNDEFRIAKYVREE